MERDVPDDQAPTALEGDLPSVLTVEEAAAVLRIGRGAASAATRRWRGTGGREGLPVLVLGRSLRVPAALLKQMLEEPSTTVPPDGAAS